jgi:hypothetical protein
MKTPTSTAATTTAETIKRIFFMFGSCSGRLLFQFTQLLAGGFLLGGKSAVEK